MQRFYVISSVVLLLIGCESTFSPKGPYQEQLVVYSILSTESDRQFVRVYTTYTPSGYDPLEISDDNSIRGAQVTFSSGEVLTSLRDTTITREDKSRYGTDVPAYVASPWALAAGSTYTLTVATQTKGTATATVTVPGHSDLTVFNPFVVREPERFSDNISLFVRIPPTTRGYLVRLYVNYAVFENDKWVPHREESASEAYFEGSEQVYIYPRLIRRSTTPSRIRPFEQETVVFTNAAYRALLGRIRSAYAERLQLQNVVFVITQVEEHLYNYYNVVNGFQDQYSIRTDFPDYSNVKGGVGVLGAMTLDSVSVSF